MIPKQSKEPKRHRIVVPKPEPKVDDEFDQEVDHEANLHSPQEDDYTTAEPLSGPEGRPHTKDDKGKLPTDQDILDDVGYMLSRHSEIDDSNIQIRVDKGEVILTGSVPQERMKFMAAEVIKLVGGVKSVNNQLKHTRPQ